MMITSTNTLKYLSEFILKQTTLNIKNWLKYTVNLCKEMFLLPHLSVQFNIMLIACGLKCLISVSPISEIHRSQMCYSFLIWIKLQYTALTVCLFRTQNSIYHSQMKSNLLSIWVSTILRWSQNYYPYVPVWVTLRFFNLEVTYIYLLLVHLAMHCEAG